MYFQPFPTINYDPTGSGYTTQIKDITTRVAVKKWVRAKLLFLPSLMWKMR